MDCIPVDDSYRWTQTYVHWVDASIDAVVVSPDWRALEPRPSSSIASETNVPVRFDRLAVCTDHWCSVNVQPDEPKRKQLHELKMTNHMVN